MLYKDKFETFLSNGQRIYKIYKTDNSIKIEEIKTRANMER